MACAITKTLSKRAESDQLEPREQTEKVDEWLLRSNNTLHYIAKLILSSSELAAFAVERCRLRALEVSPSFAREGPFRSWVFRVLIDEALLIMNRHHPSNSADWNYLSSTTPTDHSE